MELNTDRISLELEQTPQIKDSVPRDCALPPTSGASGKSRLSSVCLTNCIWTGGPYNPSSGLIMTHRLRRTVYLLDYQFVLFCFLKKNSGIARWK